MDHAEILHRCFRCGYCKFPSNYTDLNCPAYLKFRFETFSPGGRMWLLRALLDGKLTPSERFQEIMFSCAACGNCVEHCVFPGFKDQLLDAFTSGKELLIDGGHVPPTVRDYLTNLHRHGNPYKKPAKKRDAWNTDELAVKAYDGQEYLLFVGDVASYDPRGMQMTQNICKILKHLKISFGILGSKEVSDGNEAHILGEKALFEELAGKNIEQFNAAGVKQIITISPHGYHALKNKYSRTDVVFKVFHYTQVLALHLPRAIANAPANSEKQRICFHDPCYLGRHNKDYGTVRNILRTLPGVELCEMDRHMKNALCCGGGGGNYYTDILGNGEDAPARIRVREAHQTGAQILATACPKCLNMLEDAAKTENLEKDLSVHDVSEIVAQALSIWHIKPS